MLPTFTALVAVIPRHRHHRSTRNANRRSRARCCAASAPNARSQPPLRTYAEASVRQAISADSFSWEEQWYAVALSVDVVREAYPIRLFAVNYILTRRSEGSITACRRNVTLPPATVVEVQGVVWLWPGDAANADQRRVPLPVWLQRPGTEGRVLMSMARTVPVSFESLVENLVDAQHVHFAHHGAMRNWSRHSPQVSAGGGALLPPDDELGAPQPGSYDALFPKTRVRFRPPGVVWHDERYRSGSTIFYVSPVDAATSRFVFLFLSSRPPLPLKLVFALYPRWRLHATAHLIVDGDAVVLVGVERVLGAHESWKKMYGPPAGKGDSGVYHFKSWMDTHRTKMPGDVGLLPRPSLHAVDRRRILDRYHTHVVFCRDCMRALRRMRFLRVFASLGSLMLVNLWVAMLVARLAMNPGAVSLYVMKWMGYLSLVAMLMLLALRRYAISGIEELTYTNKARRLYERD